MNKQTLINLAVMTAAVGIGMGWLAPKVAKYLADRAAAKKTG